VISAQPQGDVTPLLEAVGRHLPELLRTARELADYVIVDTPPLGRVSDALRAAMTVDDIVLVTRPGNTDRTELQHTRELLDRMGHTPTGLLVVGGVLAGDAYAT
jgi:Mrp family chromosome partitioning ATPase